MSKQNFDKFINKKVKGAKKKEKIKQEKKAAKKEREAYFIEKKRQMRAEKKLQNGAQEYAKKSGKPSPGSASADKPSRNKYPKQSPPPEKSYSQRPLPAESKEKPVREIPIASKKTTETPKKVLPKSSAELARPSASPRKRIPANMGEAKPRKSFDAGLPYERQPLKKLESAAGEKEGKMIKPIKAAPKAKAQEEAVMPLNKYIAHGGVCSRRDAGELVKSGKVKVNGVVNTNPGYKVLETDEVVANGKKVTPQVNLVYILLNKPKDFITTSDDPQGRKTVLDIVKGATNERIYPVGRLDRNTSGVLLLTNDGELAQHLTHPSFEVRKIYEAKLDKPLTKTDFDKLLNGVTLEDGEVRADSVAYADSKDKSIIGIEIHSGRNRVVRRMFEHLGYDVKGLDRVMFANLTKKNVDRGKWRFLNEKEVRLLKFFNKSKR